MDTAEIVARWAAEGTEIEIRGSGAPLLFLHGSDGLTFCTQVLDRLAEGFTVIAPSHPGWGGTDRGDYRTIDDIAYRYLDLLDGFDQPIPVVGCSLGAWLAMEIATKSVERVSGLVLVSPLGIRVGGPTERYYLDRYAVSTETLQTALYGRADRAPSLADLDMDALRRLARAQEATARFTWEPYLYNPALLSRLHRISRPALLIGGSEDGFVLNADHLATIAEHWGADVEQSTLAAVGHRVEEQAPDAVAKAVHEFLQRQPAV